MKVKELKDGMILWHGEKIVGVKGFTIPDKYLECDCVKIPCNGLDYELEVEEK